MSIIGLNFGTHHASLAIYHEEKNTIEVFIDDLGARTIPVVVAFRENEVLVGQTALMQQHKNASNTFDNLHELLESNDKVYIPILDKDVTTIDLASHFFRHLHNQIKAQMTTIRDCILAVDDSSSNSSTYIANVTAAAQAGGIRVKTTIPTPIAALLANDMDHQHVTTTALVVDIGWSKCSAMVVNVCNGVFFPCTSSPCSTTDAVSGSKIVAAVADFCKKDFSRKNKLQLESNKRVEVRLKNEVEVALKILSTTPESTIHLDSFYEGIDYSCRLSRARVEDLMNILIIQLKKMLTDVADGLTIENIVFVGGFSCVPRIQSVIKSLFGSASVVSNADAVEGIGIGAAMHGKCLIKENLLKAVPTSATMTLLPADIYISDSTKLPNIPAIPRNTVLPHKCQLEIDTDSTTIGLYIYASLARSDAPILLATLAGNVSGTANITLDVKVNIEGVVTIALCEGHNVISIVETLVVEK